MISFMKYLQVHLTCVKYNGKRPDDVYYYTNVFPHDSATTITIIWITISKVGAEQISIIMSMSMIKTPF